MEEDCADRAAGPRLPWAAPARPPVPSRVEAHPRPRADFPALEESHAPTSGVAFLTEVGRRAHPQSTSLPLPSPVVPKAIGLRDWGRADSPGNPLAGLRSSTAPLPAATSLAEGSGCSRSGEVFRLDADLPSSMLLELREAALGAASDMLSGKPSSPRGPDDGTKTAATLPGGFSDRQPQVPLTPHLVASAALWPRNDYCVPFDPAVVPDPLGPPGTKLSISQMGVLTPRLQRLTATKPPKRWRQWRSRPPQQVPGLPHRCGLKETIGQCSC